MLNVTARRLTKSTPRLIAVLALVLAACGGTAVPDATTASTPAAETTVTTADTTPDTTAAPAAQPETRTIDSGLGPVEVPADPQRVAALASGAPDVAGRVGLVPIAAFEDFSAVGAPTLEGVELILSRAEPDLEALAVARPDLILAFSFDGELFPADEETLTTIAPVAAFNFNHSGQWKDYLRFWADAMNRSEEFEEHMAAYEARAAEVCARVQALEDPPEVSIVRFYTDVIALYVKSGFPGTVVEDACLPRVASQDVDDAADAAQGAEAYVIQYLLSLERLEAADGDIVFVWGGEGSEEVEDYQETVTADALWQNLGAVRNDMVFGVGNHWIGDGLTHAEAMLDDIEAALDVWEAAGQ